MKPIIFTMFFLTLLFPRFVLAENVMPAKELVESIKSGNYILYMRHGITKRKDKKTKNVLVDITRCETQRNLTKDGIAQAQHIGQAIKSLNIPIGLVTSSPFCRTQDTARLVFGDYIVDDKLAFSLTKNKAESTVLGAHLYNLMIAANDSVANTIFVGHTANLNDAIGVWPKPEGVVVVFKKELGVMVYKGMIKPSDWPKPKP